MPARSFTDQLGSQITISGNPSRIVSLVPSQTELLYDLGLDERVAGITKFCIHPIGWREKKTLVGGTKNFDTSIIDSLQPDLILGNKEENEQTGIEVLRTKYPVWMSDIFTLADAIAMIKQVGIVTETSPQANKIIDRIETNFASLKKRAPRRVLYLIWRKPWMAAGRQTFIHSMLEACGLQNCLDNNRYPVLNEDAIAALRPDVIIFSSEPFPFSEKHFGEMKALSPRSKMVIADGEMFSWYGSRLAQAPAYFESLLQLIGD